MAVAQASADAATTTAKELLAAKGPQAAFSLATACAMPNAEKAAAYSRDLTEILSATRAQFSKIADTQVAAAQSEVSTWVDGITKNAPAGTDPAGAMLKSVMASAQVGYEQINTAAKQAAEAAETQVAKASDQFTPVAKKTGVK